MEKQMIACWQYRIRIGEWLDAASVTWFDGALLRHQGSNTILEVTSVDQSHLQGVLKRIHDLHLHIVSVERLEQSTT